MDQVRLILVFFLQYPLGWFAHYCVYGTTLRHLWNILVGGLIQFYIYRMGILHVIGMTVISYLLMSLLPRNRQQSVVMVWCLSYLTVNHLYRMYINFGGFNLDISTFTMLQVCKLSALAFCYKDGSMKEEDLIPEQRQRQVKELPSIIEMCSYTWYVQNCALGVFFEFSDYKNYIERKGRYAQVESPILPSLVTLVKAIACTGFFLVGSSYYWVDYCWSTEFA